MVKYQAPEFKYFNEFVKTTTPVVPMLSKIAIKKGGLKVSELGVVCYDPETEKNSRLYNNDFAEILQECISDFELAKTTGLVVGYARDKLPREGEWTGHTFERVDREVNSMYKGMLRIIEENDGIPLVRELSNGNVIGNIVPAIAYIMNGVNRLQIQQELKKHYSLQNRIKSILEQNNTEPVESLILEPVKRYATMPMHLCGDSDKQLARMEKFSSMYTV